MSKDIEDFLNSQPDSSGLKTVEASDPFELIQLILAATMAQDIANGIVTQEYADGLFQRVDDAYETAIRDGGVAIVINGKANLQ